MDRLNIRTKTGSLKQQKICMGFSLKTSTGPEMVESIRNDKKQML